MTFCLYELARNPDIQERLYQEIKQTLSPSRHDSLTYQAVQDMPYMDQVINGKVKYEITNTASRVLTMVKLIIE